MIRDFRGRIFKEAGNGLKIAWNEEANFRFHILAAGAALGLAWILNITKTEWLFVLLAIGTVLTAEVFNTALEELCDMLRPVHDPHVGKIKDLAAGAVFLSSAFALIMGLIIFVPRLLELLWHP